MPSATEQDWIDLWAGIHELSDKFGSRLVFIGGVAVYLHVTTEPPAAQMLEFSHDGDFCISLADFSDLSDAEDVRSNRRLTKLHFVKRGIDFDVYVERQNNLRVPFNAVDHASKIIDAVRVASIEHLLILKLDAYHDRRGTTKGDKDERDLIRVVHLLRKGVQTTLLGTYWTSEMAADLARIARSSQFVVLAGGNAKQASQLRRTVQATIDEMLKELR